MAYNEKLNDRVREAVSVHDNVNEKHMFGGTCYMLNDKMCVGIVGVFALRSTNMQKFQRKKSNYKINDYDKCDQLV